MRFRVVVLAVGAILASIPLPVRAYSNVVVFGDSLSDVGNTYAATFGISPGGSPYFNGRYSNGLLWVEDMAGDQGLAAPTKSRSSGLDYAYGGAETGTGNTSLVIWNLQKQVSSYLGSNTPASTQLITLWAGANDFFDGQTNAATPVNNIATSIGSLASAGAKTFLVPNLPLLGETPEYRGTSNQAPYDSLTTQFNAQLATKLTSLASTLNVQIYQLDVASFFSSAVANPAAYGFTNVTDSAYNGSTVVSNPNQYLFWDGVHPTARGHTLLAQVASDLLDTHNWNASQTSAAFNATSSWSPAGAPASRWIANLANNSAAPRTAVVSADSAVQKIRIDGASQKMTLAIQSGATLTATELSMSHDASLAFELAGNGQSAKLALSGAATLGGTISVSLAGAFVSLPGSSYPILTFGSRAGDVSVVNQTGLAGLRFDKTYTATSLTLTASARGGDANLDGFVDVTDLGALATNWQTSSNWLGGDFNFDGIVDVSDLGILATNWQLSAGSLNQALSEFGINPTSAPEPLASVLLPCLAAAASRRRARQTRRGRDLTELVEVRG